MTSFALNNIPFRCTTAKAEGLIVIAIYFIKFSFVKMCTGTFGVVFVKIFIILVSIFYVVFNHLSSVVVAHMKVTLSCSVKKYFMRKPGNVSNCC